jgi:hypothetical protein
MGCVSQNFRGRLGLRDSHKTLGILLCKKSESQSYDAKFGYASLLKPNFK